ncbi:hypothetical protein TNCV_3291911 [Trichonephila clavipes]|nr:hypothetical protein TNCV_3291911 [Trichonephila clavipes]
MPRSLRLSIEEISDIQCPVQEEPRETTPRTQKKYCSSLAKSSDLRVRSLVTYPLNKSDHLYPKAFTGLSRYRYSTLPPITSRQFRRLRLLNSFMINNVVIRARDLRVTNLVIYPQDKRDHICPKAVTGLSTIDTDTYSIAYGNKILDLLLGVGNASPFFGGVRGTPRNSSACKQQQGRYTNYCCNPYGKAAPHHSSPLSD